LLAEHSMQLQKSTCRKAGSIKYSFQKNLVRRKRKEKV
jgi:hypothetical protein